MVRRNLCTSHQEQTVKSFFNLTLPDLERAIGAAGNEKYRSRQLYQWVYQKCVFDTEEMTNISKSLRNIFGAMFDMSLPTVEDALTSRDGSTKFSFRAFDGKMVESVLIPEKDRNTLCISTQVGCRMGCKFCITGKIGFVRNLIAAEIVGQIVAVKARIMPDKITNIVFMGMGEPMDNLIEVTKAIEIIKTPLGLDFSRRRITVSSAGLLDALKTLEGGIAGIAISLNAADDATRTAIMPVNRLYPIEKIIEFTRTFKQAQRERITFEYVMIGGINDSIADARELVRLLKGVKCKINLIPYNESPYIDYRSPDDETVNAFHQYLLERHFTVIVRNSRGRDVCGGCGQLGIEYVKEKYHGNTAGI